MRSLKQLPADIFHFPSPLAGEGGGAPQARRRMRGRFSEFWRLQDSAHRPLIRRFAPPSPARGEGKKSHIFWPLAFLVFFCGGAAQAKRIANPIAVFNGLDKITGVTTTFEIAVGEEKRFGGMIVKPRVCYSRPVTETPKTTSFVEVDELETDKKRKRVFSGWMFAESPGLNAVEHPVFDVWLTNCRDPNAAPPVVEAAPDLSTLQEQVGDEQAPD